MQAEPVMPLRDPTSDMAVIARAGSKLVKDIREKKEASKSRKRFWEMAGSKMGKITGMHVWLCFMRNNALAVLQHRCSTSGAAPEQARC